MRLFVLSLLILVNFTAFAASGHAIDFCQDQDCSEMSEGCDSKHAEVQSTTNHQGHSSESPHDCSCDMHHYNCSHHPVHPGRAAASVGGPKDTHFGYLSALLTGPVSPYIEGPFQPPRA